MEVIGGRFWVKLVSSEVLVEYMAYRGFTVRDLAERAKCSPATVGHLRSGKRQTCKTQTATAIAKALQAPVGTLFLPQVSRVARNTKTVKKSSLGSAA